MSYAVSPFEGKDFHFFHIVPCSIGTEAERAQEAAEVHRRTGISCFLYSLTLHPEGYPAMKKAERLIESYRNFAKAMASHGLKAGVLLQSIIGHWPRTDKNEEKWTRTVDVKGNIKRFCVLDKEYQEYIRTVVTLLAKEQPCFMLGDDDIRSFSPDLECFCPLHTAEFNRRAGTSFTQDEYREAIANAEVGSTYLNIFEELRVETICGLADLIRSAIDSVDPSIGSGVCMPGWEYRTVGEYAGHIAGANQPAVLRLANAMYMEDTAPLYLSANYIQTQARRIHYSDIPLVLDEADSFPHSLFSRSSVGMHAKLISSIFAGAGGAKLWFAGMTTNHIKNSEHYMKVLEANKGLYQTLTREVRNTESKGTVIPASENFPKWHPAKLTWTDNEQFAFSKGNPQLLPGIYGLPMRAAYGSGGSDAVLLANGRELYRFTDDELKNILSGKVLVMGDAATEITRRGMGEYIGCHAEPNSRKFNRERFEKDGMIFPVSAGEVTPLLTQIDPAAEVLTTLLYAPDFAALPEELEEVAPGSILYRNKLGGTVCVTANSPEAGIFFRRDLGKVYFRTLLEAVYGGMLPYSLDDFHTCMMIQRDTAEGAGLLGIFNLNFDAMDTVTLRCARIPGCLEMLNGNGTWEKLPFRAIDEHRIVIDRELPCYGCLIIRTKG